MKIYAHAQYIRSEFENKRERKVTATYIASEKSWSLEELGSQKEPIPLPRRKISKLLPDVGKGSHLFVYIL